MHVLLHIIALVSLAVIALGGPLYNKKSSSATSCGYESCHAIKEDLINVHIVPHTHDDVGWLKTVDQYYYGSNTNDQNAGVQYILDTVVDSLRKDPNRRFIYVETAFFWKWWIKQHDIVKSRVRKLVKSGQLEFISGGWSMNDEAATHYHSIIDQMTWGLRKLNDTFGECGRPKIGWQIDPFGHSREMANIFAELGFDALLLGRIDYQEKLYRWETKTPEMVWRGSDSLGESSDIFTGILYNTYAPPPGFCFDILCSDEPFIDDKKSFEYNVDTKVKNFIDYLNNATKVYNTNNILITMGEDFNYQDAESWFINLDKLIYYVNKEQDKYNLIYSTPSCYVKAIHDETNGKKSWLLKQDDFFPYSSDPHAFWTGYFTSRPAIKRFERIGNNFLQVCKQLYALANLGPEDKIDLNVLREAMGVMQHHDAITGTEKQHVANDYARYLQKGIEECEIITDAALNKILNQTTDENGKLKFNTCPLLNISQCAYTENSESFTITIYNPLSRPVNKFVRIPVQKTAYKVMDSPTNEIEADIIPIPEFIKNIPGRESSKAEYELTFAALNITPLGFKSFRVSEVSNLNQVLKPIINSATTEFALDNIGITLDEETGLLQSVQLKKLNLSVTQNWYYYEGFVGDNRIFENRSSGAYIFRPDGKIKKITDKKITTKAYEGKTMSEFHQQFNEFTSQIIRINHLDSYVEFDWIIGPLPNKGAKGIEVVSKFSTNLETNAEFYTDSNGKSSLLRKRNFRPTWKLNLSEPESGNYYPITTDIKINDADLEVAVLVDRAQGGSSLNDGEIELMVHRVCLHDDAFGVGEALNETAFDRGLIIRGSHYLTFGAKNSDETAATVKDIKQRKLLDSWIFFSEDAPQVYEYSGLRYALPKNVQILTLEPWIGFSFLLRIEHVFEINETAQLSNPVEINLSDLFTPFQIESVQETTLGANQWLKDNKRLHFDTNGTLEELSQDFQGNSWSGFCRKLCFEEDILRIRRTTAIINLEDFELNIIRLLPGEIRTFIVEIQTN